MAREGTRSQTGHATPRVFAPVDTTPVIKRKKSPKTKTTKVPIAAKPVGVTKKTKVPKKEGSVVAKVKTATKKVIKKAAGKPETKVDKPKTAAKKIEAAAASKKTEPVLATQPEPVAAA